MRLKRGVLAAALFALALVSSSLQTSESELCAPDGTRITGRSFTVPPGTVAYRFVRVSGTITFDSESTVDINVTTTAGVNVVDRRTFQVERDGVSFTLDDNLFGSLRRNRVVSIRRCRDTLEVEAVWEGKLGFVPLRVPLTVLLSEEPFDTQGQASQAIELKHDRTSDTGACARVGLGRQ